MIINQNLTCRPSSLLSGAWKRPFGLSRSTVSEGDGDDGYGGWHQAVDHPPTSSTPDWTLQNPPAGGRQTDTRSCPRGLGVPQGRILWSFLVFSQKQTRPGVSPRITGVLELLHQGEVATLPAVTSKKKPHKKLNISKKKKGEESEQALTFSSWFHPEIHF